MTLDRTLRERIARMPKAEIHVHLEGATTAETYFEIAQRNGIELDGRDLPQWQSYFHFADFGHFIEVYVRSTKFLRTPDDYALLVDRFAAQQAALNVKYTEAFVSCSLVHESTDRSAFLDALVKGSERAQREHGVIVRFIGDISRELPESQIAVLELVREGFQRGAFIGLGLGGPEIGFPPEEYVRAYTLAREAGMHVVAHAGETVGPPSIIGALDALGAERIGHGVRCLEDPALVERLKRDRIALEVCPQSNYRLGVVGKDETHPIRELVDLGVRCTINSDDPAMFDTDLNREYETLAEQGFTWDELWALNRATLDATFVTVDERRALEAEWVVFDVASSRDALGR